MVGLGRALGGAMQTGAGGGASSAAATGSSFVPRTTESGGMMTLIVQTVDANSGAVINNLAYHLNRNAIFKKPIVIPAAQLRSA